MLLRVPNIFGPNYSIFHKYFHTFTLDFIVLTIFVSNISTLCNPFYFLRAEETKQHNLHANPSLRYVPVLS